MNNLTKEELEEIKRCLQYMITSRTTPYSLLTIDVNKKIQHMIYSYCEHEKMENTGGWVWKCVKCGMSFGDETQ